MNASDRAYLNGLNETPEGRALLAVMVRDADTILAFKARRTRLENAAKRALMERDPERVNRYMIAADAITWRMENGCLGVEDEERWDADASEALAN